MISIVKDQDWVRGPYIAIVCILFLFIHLWWVWKRKLPVYLLEFQVYEPPDRFVIDTFMCAIAICFVVASWSKAHTKVCHNACYKSERL